MTNGARSPAEELGNAILSGEPVKRGDGGPAEQGHAWGSERVLQASELYELLVLPQSATTRRAAVLEGLRISGRLNLQVCELKVPLICHGCYFDEPVNLMAATVVGIQLTACHVPGLAADQLVTRGDLDLSWSKVGVVSLPGAHVGGNLLLDGTTLSGGRHPIDLGDGCLHPQGRSLSTLTDVSLMADRLKVDGDMACKRGFRACGEVRLPGAHIAGQLVFNEAKLSRGLTADGLKVDGDMFCKGGFRARGEVRLPGAHIIGQLVFNRATLHQGLTADGLMVDEDMFCDDGFRAHGEVRMLGAHVTGQLSFLEVKPIDVRALTLDLRGVRVDEALFLSSKKGFACEIDLRHARVGELVDRERTWPKRLKLGGLVYGAVKEEEPSDSRPKKKQHLSARKWWRLRRGVPDVEQRLRWIRRAEEGPSGESSRSDGYVPQPYTQLMAFYRREGRDGDARRVAYERERRHWHQLGKTGKAWNLFLRWTVGYGYRPLRALGLLVALLLVGTCVFSSFHTAHEIVPVKNTHPPFDAIIYTLDRLIPVVSFGLREAYAPKGAAQWWSFSYALLGWTLSIAVIAGLNSAVRRDD